MSSTQLRKLNAYPEWKTEQGINNVIKFVISLQDNDPNKVVYPQSVKTTIQKKRFMEKFGNGDFQVDTEKPIIGGVATRNKGLRVVGKYSTPNTNKNSSSLENNKKAAKKRAKEAAKEAAALKKAKKEADMANRKAEKEEAKKAKQEKLRNIVKANQEAVEKKEEEERHAKELAEAKKKEDERQKAENDRIKADEDRQKKEEDKRAAIQAEKERLSSIKAKKLKIGKKFRQKVPRLYYRPLIEGTNTYRIDNLILYPNEKEEALKELFNDLSIGAGIGIKAFYAQVSQYYLGFTRIETSLFLKKQGSYNISRPYKKSINRPVIAKSSNERWSIDLIVMARYHFKPTAKQSTNSEFIANMNKENEGGKYTHILSCVDFFSKKVWTRPLVSGEASFVKTAFNSIMVEARTKPRILMTDNGVEFISDEFKNYLKRLDIKQILTKPYASTSNGLIERINRMIRSKIRDGFVRHNNLEWVKYLPQYTENINNQKPSRGKYSPNMLWTPGYFKPTSNVIDTKIEITDNSSIEDIRKSQQYKYIQRAENQIKDDLRGSENQISRNFKIGDKVRIRLPASISDTAKEMLSRHKGGNFDVKYSAVKFTPSLFTIFKVIDKKPRRKKGEDANDAEIRFKLLNPAKTTYVLKDENGNLVKEINRKTGESLKTPKYFFKNDLQLIPEGSIPSIIDTIARTQQLNRFDRYIPFVDNV